MGFKIVLLSLLAAFAMSFAIEVDFDDEYDAEVLEAFLGDEIPNLNHLTDPVAFGEHDDDDHEPLVEAEVPGAVGILISHGYRTKVHYVTTDDGYILQLENIIGNSDTAKNCPKKKRPVLMVHGVLDSSATWVITGPNDSLATQLNDLCYDVWLGNVRGNRHSRRHRTLNPDGRRRERREFWSFSWHEIGIYDLPAMIDYVLTRNDDYKKLFYVGHSQGTTSFFVMGSIRPEYNDKIQLANLLAPVAIMQNATSPIGRTLAKLLVANQHVLSAAGHHELLPGNDLAARLEQRFCRQNIAAGVCKHFLFLIAGYNPDLFNNTALNDILLHAPAGASINQIVHYGQLLSVPDFRHFDHGRIENRRRYGTIAPPIYPTHNIRARVALYYSQNDLLANTENVERLARTLPNVVHKHLIPHDRFNHFDFLWALNLKYWVNNNVVRQIQLADRA